MVDWIIRNWKIFNQKKKNDVSDVRNKKIKGFKQILQA